MKNYAQPIAILIGLVSIALAINSLDGLSYQENRTQAITEAVVGNVDNTITVAEVLPSEHILGDFKDPITIIEYSDLECPFCKRFHPNMEEVMAQRDDVRWVYRHFPLDQIHREATPAARASECIGSFGGNDAFWEFVKSAFANQKSLGDDFYLAEAQRLGVDKSDYLSCYNSDEVDNVVQSHLRSGRTAGVTGTPHSIIIGPNGTVPVSGAQSTADIIRVIEQVQ